MASLNIQLTFHCELNQREFSVITRALSGQPMKGNDQAIAKHLNRRLLEARQEQIKNYAKESIRALKVAQNEMDVLLKEHPEWEEEDLQELEETTT